MRHKQHFYTIGHAHKWKYKNITFAGFGVLIAVILSQIEAFHIFLMHIGEFGYIGAFIAGMLFVSTFTVATGVLVLLILAETVSPVKIGLIAGLGAVVGDFTIFHFVKNNLTSEVTHLFKYVDREKHLTHLFHTKYFNWLLPVFGAMIIASPFPDELGVSLMGLSQMNTTRFIIISYILNSLGIFAVISASTVIKP